MTQDYDAGVIRRPHLVLASGLLFIGVVWLTGQQRREPVRMTFERLSREIVVLGPDEFIYGFRETRQIPRKEFEPVREFTRFLENGTWSSSDFLPLLKHDDPKISPWWAIGAAQLNIKEGDSILEQAYSRFQGQYDSAFQLELAHAMWRLVGETHATTVADWIYKELAKPTGQESNMLDEMLRTEGRKNALLAGTLIEDPRFDELNWKSVETIAKAVNSWIGKEVVSPHELESAWSPLGFDFFMRDKTKGLEQYPKEIGELLKRLSLWREALRASVPVLIKH